MPAEYAFDIHSAVGRYWLVNSEGFDVVVERGRRVGVVEDVVLNPYTQEVSGVVVRRAVRRPAEVAVDELKAVLPASRRFLVTPELATSTRRETFLELAGRMRVGWRRARRALRHGWRLLSAAGESVAEGARARWPAVRRVAAVVARKIGQALVLAALLTAAFANWAWRTGRRRLRESGQKARSRAERQR